MDTDNACDCGGTCQEAGGDPVSLGIMLGVANALVIAIGIAVMKHQDDAVTRWRDGASTWYGGGLSIVGSVFMIGFIPAVFTGAALGRLAHRARAWRPWLRGVVLVVPALLVVVGLADMFRMQEYIVVASIPTLAAAAWLERRTRDARVPAARALRRDSAI